MDKSVYFQKYAEAVVKVGVNIQPGQILVAAIPTEYRELAVEITKAAFSLGAKDVVINWMDPVVEHYRMLGASEEVLREVHAYEEARVKYYIEQEACSLACCIFYPDLDLDVPDAKLKAAGEHQRFLRKLERDGRDKTGVQWAAFVVGNPDWAAKIYPELPEEERNELFFKQVAGIVRIDEESDPVENWKKHCADLSRYSGWLNEQKFDRMRIRTGLGTKLEIGLVKNNIWCSAAEMGDNQKVAFCANMPTEEIFTDPDKRRVDGIVYASRPLYVSGRMVENFWIRFEKGRAVECHAEKEQKALEELLAIDESCRYLGELALVPASSPISRTGQCYYFVPLDENAAGHIALGTSFPSCVRGGMSMTKEELDAIGVNNAPIHCDFMYGTADMEVDGVKEDGTVIPVMRAGEFVEYCS